VRSAQAIINPELLYWARDKSGIDIDIIARRMKVPVEKIKKWETGESRPTVAQLKNLANIYKRPFSIFYLSKVPKDFKIPHDYRILESGEEKTISPQLRYEIRLANYRRENVIDLFKLNNEQIPRIKQKANLDENKEILGEKIRGLIGIDLDEQYSWNSDYEAFNSWRDSISNLGILIFQAAQVSEEEMRGISIFHEDFPIILINNQDTVRGRIFSIMHEFVHVFLNKSGLCNFREIRQNTSTNQKIEVFCNHVAGAILVPKNNLLREKVVNHKARYSEWEDSEIDYLSNRYSTSRETIIRRLLIFNKTTFDFYKKKREQYINQYRERKSKKSKGYPQYHLVELSKIGHYYSKLVLTNYYQNKITSSKLSEYLGMKLKHLPKIETELFA